MTARNDVELQNLIDSAVQKALDFTTVEVLQKLEDYIQTEVYDVHSEWEDLGFRTGEFKESWDRSNAKVVAQGIIESEIFQNVSVMKTSLNPPIHIDKDSLAQIINSGVGYNFGAFEGMARPFWDNFLTWLNGNLIKIFHKYCNNVGLPTSISFGTV